MWIFSATIFADFTHCGCNLPWYPCGVFPFGAPIIFHDYHHSSNIGNYGHFGILYVELISLSQIY